MKPRDPNWDQEHEMKGFVRLIEAPVAQQARLTASLGLGRFAVQHLRGGCLGRCVFCANRGTSGDAETTPWTDITRHLRKASGVDVLCVGGNEPMLHPRFESAISLAQERGYRRIQVMTSGLPLALRGAARRLRALGLTELAIPIYSARPDVHDGIFGAPVHSVLLRALDNAASAGIVLRLHTLALRANLAELCGLSEWARNRWGARVAVGMARGKPGVFDYQRATPSLDAVIMKLKGSLPLLVGFPICAAKSMDTDEAKPPAVAECTALYFTIQRRVHTKACADCAGRQSCPGVVKAHADSYGAVGLNPRKFTGAAV